MDGVANETATFNPLVVLPVFLSAVWIIWDLFYASFFFAFFVRTILNLFLKDTGIYIGQLSLNLIAGRIVFKDVEIYRKDDSIRITDGYGVLRWWRRRSANEDEGYCKKCSCQSSACANRKNSLIFIHLNGFEYHWYHRSDIYDAWGQLKINEPDVDSITGDSWITSIQPTLHYTINKGRLVFGNNLVEKNLVVQFDQAEGHYSLTRASNDYDEAMHLFMFHGDNIIASLQPTPGYVNSLDTILQEEFVVLQTDFVDCVYSLDIPGLVPIDDTSSPKYAFDVKLGTNTVANYGTYVNRQRIILQKLFFPNDYTIRHVDRIPQPGEKRVYTSFDVSVFVSTPAKLDITFQGQSNMSSLSFNVSGSSYLTVNQPWVTKEDGYTTTISGHLTDLEAHTSLPFEPLGKAENVNISTSLHFPRLWNSKQTWDMNFTTDQTQINILFSYVDFFNELLDDWIGNDTIDIVDFVPLDWKIGIDFCDYEIFLYTNRYNWIDTALSGVENERLAFCGKSGHISVKLPFTEFLPNQQKILFSAHGENIVVRHYFPPSSVFKESSFALSSANKYRWRTMDPPETHNTLTRSVSQPIEPSQYRSSKIEDLSDGREQFKRTHRRRGSEPLSRVFRKESPGERMSEPLKDECDRSSLNKELFPMGCCMTTSYQSGWLDLACGPSIDIDIVYHNHNSDMTHVPLNKNMVPSQVIVNVDAPCVLLRVFGFLARDLLSLKENYPGEYMYFKTFSANDCRIPESAITEEKIKPPASPDLSNGPHEPDERFLDVIVHFKLRNITGEFPTHLLKGYPQDFPLPSGHSDSFSVLVEYRGNETAVQLNVEPITVHLPSMGSTESSDYDLGILALSGVSFTCHGFTEFLLKERVEYAWMMKLEIGKVTGSVTGEQLFPVADFFQTIIGHIFHPGSSSYEAPDAILIEPNAEPLSELLKYKLFALSISTIDVHLRESNTLLNIQTPGFDLDLCNLHNGVQTLAISLCFKSLHLSSFTSSPTHSSMLLECACCDIGSVYGDIALREPHEAYPDRQQYFLKRADESSHRLWFLWDNNMSCGCCGGCQFLDGFICRDDTPVSKHKTRRYFSSNGTFSGTTSSDYGKMEQFPTHISFDSLSSIDHLHHIALNYYGFIDPPPNVSSSKHVTTSYEGVVIAIDTVSVDSEATFDTAPTSLPSPSEEAYASLENSPQASVKNSRPKEIEESTTPITHTAYYSNVLDKYWCNYKNVKIAERIPYHQVDETSNLLSIPGSSTQPSPWRTNKKGITPKRTVPCFVLKIPEICHSSVGQLPSVVSNASHYVHYERISHYSSDAEKELDSTSSAFVSININVGGSIGLLFSPPVVDVINKYISCANKLFVKRTAHAFLDGIKFEAMQKVNSQLSYTVVSNDSSISVPSNNTSPLVHLSVAQSPSSTCVFQMGPISLDNNNKGTTSDKRHSSFATVFASGIACNAMIYHHSLSVGKEVSSDGNEDSYISDNVQMTIRLAADLQLPVLQAGLFVLSDYKEPLGIVPAHSFINFEVCLPPSIMETHQIISIAEMSINKSSATIAAKIIQSELSSDPILTWCHVNDHLNKNINYAMPCFRDDSEQSHNTIAVSVDVPLVRCQVGAPCHGIPNSSDVGIDLAIVVTFIKVWKPLIEDVLLSGMIVWKNKIVRDRCLLLAMLSSALEKPKCNHVLMPLLTDVSRKIRDSVSFSFIDQLCFGLSSAVETNASELPQSYKEGFLLQEIMAMSLALSLKLLTQQYQSSTASPVQMRNSKSRHMSGRVSTPSGGPTVVSYHSISPSPSDLGVPNVLFTPQQLNPTSGMEHSDYQLLTEKASYNHFILLRESLLPVFKSSNIIIASQLKKHSHNSSVLIAEYKLQLPKTTLVVVNGLEDTHQQPELIVEQLCISGSLKYTLESRIVAPKAVNYIVTVRHKTNIDDSSSQKLRSNVMSKCSISLETLALHISLPLMIVIRHTSESLHHMRQYLQDLAQIPQTLLIELQSATDTNDINISSNVWKRGEQLKNVLIELEGKYLPSPDSVTVQSTPNSRRNVLIQKPTTINITHSDSLRESQSLSSVASEHIDSPMTDDVTKSHHILSSSSHGAEHVEDTTDSPQIFSSDPEAPIQSSMATYDTSKSVIKDTSFDVEQYDVSEITPNVREILSIPDDQLEFSIYGSVRIACIHISTRIESLLLLFEVQGISGSVDCRKATNDKSFSTGAHYHVPIVYSLLPTYLSVASTLRRTTLRVIDPVISNSDLAILLADHLELSTSCCYVQENPAPCYRCLVQFPNVLLDVKQPPIVLHKKFHKYIPTFSVIYEDVFAPSSPRTIGETTPGSVNVSDIQFPPHLPKGSVLFFLKHFKMIVRPLPSLMVSYEIAPVTAQVETVSIVKLVLSVGQHQLEFNTKEYKDELSLRPIPLPVILLKGNIVPTPFNRIPSVTLEIAVKQVVIDVTTDVLNQLLILQIAFIKEINELLNMFLNIGESLPQEKLASINLKQPADTGFEIMSLVNTIKLSMQGVKVTVSTPLATAVRFSTGNKIEMLITNPNHQLDTLPTKSYLTLHGKVETEINVALGFIPEESGIEEEDDFIELAYFKTWIAVRNTLQQNTPLAEAVDGPVSLDTFLISIYSPHLYIQSTAVEKAILFWVNCKSVYNFWQNEHKQLNAEVQAATEAFVGRLTKPNVQLKTPSIDFSKPRFVQITVSDVGACMPLIHLPTTPHASQRGFPAVVLTIKEMHVSLNLSKKLASAGKFTGFLIRFDEQFHFRHKTWTTEPKKHKFLNCGVVPSGTYKLCVTNKKSPDDIEKILSAFTWHMSGININASTDIGHHISTLVHTLTTIGSDLEEPDTQIVPPVPSPVLTRAGHKRAQSFTSKSFVDDQAALRAMEWDLARQTRKLNKLKQTGAAPDSLKSEEDVFHKLEMDLVRGLRRVFRKGRGVTLQQIGQIFSGSSVVPNVAGSKKRFNPYSTLPRKRKKSANEDDFTTTHHVRHKSDISPDVFRLINSEEVSTSSLDVVEEISCESQDHDEVTQYEKQPTSKPRESLIPSVNIEINMTISVDSGSIILHSEDLMSQEHLGSKPTKDKSKSSIDTVVLIPAVEIKTHYKSVVGQVPPHSAGPTAESFNNELSHSSSSASHSTPICTPVHTNLESDAVTPQTDLHVIDKSGNPIKKGVLIISAVVAPLPHDLELNPGLLDFVEQVVRPINVIGAQDNEEFPDSDDDDDDDFMEEIDKETSAVQSHNSFNPLSFPVDVSITFTVHPSRIYLTCNPHAHVKCLIEIPTVNFAISFSLFVRKQAESNLQSGCDSWRLQSQFDDDIATFNNLNVTGCFKTFSLVMFTPASANTGKQEKKDKEAFNLVLGQAYVHLSRKSVYGTPSSPQHSLNDSIAAHEKLQVSVIPVIESLLLTYDWRRLNDITLFRKCWYHTGLVEALFTGSKHKDDNRLPSSPLGSPFTSPSHSVDEKDQGDSNGINDDTITAEIVIAVSVVDLRLYANMAQFMGNSHVILSHLQGLCHTDIQDNELRLLICDGEIEDMEIDAEGGVVAGDLIIKKTQLHILSSYCDKVIPEHKARINTDTVQGHIDYMSAHIMLLRVVDLCVQIWDVWKGITQDSDHHQMAPSIQICASLEWGTFQLAIHRSTAKAMFGIAQKMYDFVMLQKKRSERTIGLMLPAGTAASTAFAAYQEDQKRAERSRAADIENPLLEYHHWIWAIKVGSKELLKSAGITNYSDHNDVSLGGSIKVSGTNICLVCFHGTSFRESEWAAFNIDYIEAEFITVAIPGLGELKDSKDEEIKTRICNQKCQLRLSQNESKLTELAAVYRVSAGRGGVPPISRNEIADWLNYACIDHHIHTTAATLSSLFLKQSQKLHVQQIIGIPAFSVTLTNDHFWPSLSTLMDRDLSSLTDCATIECSLSSEFHGDISVTTTVENYLFLHDLFSAYVDHLKKQQMSFRPPFASVSSSSTTTEPVSLRHFVCMNWELDPHLLLIGKATWASGQFNPHINWLLERLGFDHARTTIPEYIQRGLMDPLDLGIASLLEILITLSGTDKVKS